MCPPISQSTCAYLEVITAVTHTHHSCEGKDNGGSDTVPMGGFPLSASDVDFWSTHAHLRSQALGLHTLMAYNRITILILVSRDLVEMGIWFLNRNSYLQNAWGISRGAT